MARINVPQKQVRSAGSTGVKADIDINSSAFRSAANLGATIGQEVERVGQAKERVAIEGQRVVDGGIGANYTREKSVFGREIQTSMMSEDLIGNHEAQRKSFDAQVKEREVAINEQLKEASPEQRQRILDVWEDDKASMDAQFRANRQREAVAKSVAQFEGAIEEHMLNGDMDAANALIKQMPITESAQIERSNRLKKEVRAIQHSELTLAAANAQTTEEIDLISAQNENSQLSSLQKDRISQKLITRRNSLFSERERVSMEEFKLISAQTNRGSDIDDIKTQINADKTLSKDAKASLDRTLELRRITIRNSDISTLSDNLDLASKDFNMAVNGVIVSELQLSDSYDPKTRDAIVHVLESQGGPRGTDSFEYVELLEDVESFDGTGLQDDITLAHKKKVIEFLEDPENSTDAKMSIASESIAGLSIDVRELEVEAWLGLKKNPDGTEELEWRDENKKLDQSQSVAIRDFSFKLNELVLGANQKADFKDSIISAKSTLELFMFIHRADVIESFAGIEDPEGEGRAVYEEKFEKVFEKRFNEAIAKESKLKFRKRISAVNAGIRDLR